ncbi:UNKNOWN [Stylonychia lemnae]|uniref:Uncharacterized protein n=1 Tax=Stylonychia lemnae TaxID=5949 RepID=A0A078AS73_STYLE|nr:UNKNOWN [Stylonychia lemnae]|eukprot:CDW85024.1 UNKNOWN [Stylonychia lemnae]
MTEQEFKNWLQSSNPKNLKKKSKVIVEVHDGDEERNFNGEFLYSQSKDYEMGDALPNQEIDNISMMNHQNPFRQLTQQNNNNLDYQRNPELERINSNKSSIIQLFNSQSKLKEIEDEYQRQDHKNKVRDKDAEKSNWCCWQNRKKKLRIEEYEQNIGDPIQQMHNFITHNQKTSNGLMNHQGVNKDQFFKGETPSQSQDEIGLNIGDKITPNSYIIQNQNQNTIFNGQTIDYRNFDDQIQVSAYQEIVDTQIKDIKKTQLQFKDTKIQVLQSKDVINNEQIGLGLKNQTFQIIRDAQLAYYEIKGRKSKHSQTLKDDVLMFQAVQKRSQDGIQTLKSKSRLDRSQRRQKTLSGPFELSPLKNKARKSSNYHNDYQDINMESILDVKFQKQNSSEISYNNQHQLRNDSRNSKDQKVGSHRYQNDEQDKAKYHSKTNSIQNSLRNQLNQKQPNKQTINSSPQEKLKAMTQSKSIDFTMNQAIDESIKVQLAQKQVFMNKKIIHRNNNIVSIGQDEDIQVGFYQTRRLDGGNMSVSHEETLIIDDPNGYIDFQIDGQKRRNQHQYISKNHQNALSFDQSFEKQQYQEFKQAINIKKKAFKKQQSKLQGTKVQRKINQQILDNVFMQDAEIENTSHLKDNEVKIFSATKHQSDISSRSLEGFRKDTQN